MCFGNDTQKVVSSTDVPDWLLPYYQKQANVSGQILDSAVDIYNDNAAYDPYPHERLQSFTTDQLTAQEMARQNAGLTGQPALGQQQLSAAMGLTDQAAGGWSGGQYDPNQVSADQFGERYTADRFDSGDAAAYMDPYKQQVIDRTVAEMERSNQRRRLADDTRATQAGAFGGSRHAVLDSLREEDFDRQLGNTVASLYDQGYSRAQDQYNTDENRGLQGFGANAAVGAADASRTLQADLANQTTGLQAFNANREQFNTDQARALAAGQNMAGIADQAQSMGLKDVASVMAVGDMGQQLGQTGLDLAYQDWQNQKAAPYQQLGWLQGAASGQPVSNPAMFTSQTQTQPGPNAFSQILGAGIAAAGTAGQLGWKPF